MKELKKVYEAKKVEDKIYKLWEKSGFFNPDVCQKKGITKNNAKPFSVILPPPNVTGALHMGHAAMLAVEDILIRYRRMKGDKTLWLPGTDHAAIATESRVEQDLYKKEGKTRHDLGREAFLELVNQFAQESHDAIVHQIKKLGASLDWGREAYTLDAARSLAVKTAFASMYKEELIYRGERIVNWDPKMQTTVSDDEIEWKEEKTPFYYLKYGPFAIATARPETKFGDKYVVMHPKDKRYTKYKNGQTIDLEWINGKVTATIIKDDSIDMDFGSGAMTITPWHDRTDFEISERHNLDKEQIIDSKGKLLPVAGKLAGLHISKARPLVIEKLKKKGLLDHIEKNYIHRVAINSRGGGIIEPQIMRQWFIDVNKEFSFPHSGIKGIKKGQKTTLKKLMLHTVKTGQIQIVPRRFEKTYYHWIKNLRDWCISRQIWFGHQIPVWYKEKSNNPSPKDSQKIGFHINVVPQVFAGKTKIYRLRDHNFKIGDKIYLENSQAKEIFGIGEITNVEKTAAKNINLKDPLHGATYNKIEELIAAFKRHYKDQKITPNTKVFIYTYKFTPLKEDKEIYVGVTPPKETGWQQDPDTLDTWFSSGLWTFSTLGWPKKTKDLKTYHPTSVLETGYDILFFWVARMILMSTYFLGEVPFRTVYLHGLVRDEKGRKMSKSLQNVIDPLDMSQKYGADATRLSLIIGAAPGNDIKLSEDRVRGYRNFINKLWNISRFVMMETKDFNEKKSPNLSAKDKAILKDFEKITKKTSKSLDEFRLSHAAEDLYHYIWHTYADKVIEDSKPVLKDKKTRQARQYVLVKILSDSLRLLHPFVPFVTEEIYQQLPLQKKEKTIMIAPWPK